jgi:hypothetical protein
MREFQQNHFRAKRSLPFVLSRVVPFNPRNPQRQSITGHAKDSSGKRKNNAHHFLHSLSAVCTRTAGHVGGSLRPSQHIDLIRSA